ncbi:conserved hypothetical protein [uncultured Mycobacterium sp.]|uniref:Uncharacterized protein n=1 Tax=uncultured Mycobacterium sp. TaxID=171292 RepID=A0A1Y5PHX7_9MYCO|nr:conserved hypothetical protein [uncultured Mycobacterium sp.]
MISSDSSLHTYFEHVPVIPPNPSRLNAEARLEPFRVPGDSSSLNGVYMVAAVANRLNLRNGLGPVYREKLREVFFDYFGRETLSRFSDNPDAEFDAALDRAVDLDLVLKASGRPGEDADQFAGGWQVGSRF